MCFQDRSTNHRLVNLWIRNFNLVPRAFLRRGEDGREKTLASADHVIFKHPEKLGVIN